ncbi:hypothetical protein L9F63_018201, partial [Diploptera punctata]
NDHVNDKIRNGKSSRRNVRLYALQGSLLRRIDMSQVHLTQQNDLLGNPHFRGFSAKMYDATHITR